MSEKKNTNKHIRCEPTRHSFSQVNEPADYSRGRAMSGIPIAEVRGVRLYCISCGEVRELGK